MGILRGVDSRSVLHVWRQWRPVACRITHRCDIHSFECERKSYRTVLDDSIQFAVWNHFIFICLLRRNDNLSGNDYADGCLCAYHMVEASI